MLRFLSKWVRKFQTANTARTPRRAPRRSMLQLEGLEDRMLLSAATASLAALPLPIGPGPFPVGLLQPPATATQNPSTGALQVTVNQQNQQITFEVDPHQH